MKSEQKDITMIAHLKVLMPLLKVRKDQNDLDTQQKLFVLFETNATLPIEEEMPLPSNFGRE